MVVESATASSLRLGVAGLAEPGEIGTTIVVEFPRGRRPRLHGLVSEMPRGLLRESLPIE